MKNNQEKNIISGKNTILSNSVAIFNIYGYLNRKINDKEQN
jgi:hypothetical protein